MPETTTNWPLVGGLAGALVTVAVVLMIALIFVIRKRRLHQATRGESLQKGDLGHDNKGAG